MQYPILRGTKNNLQVLVKAYKYKDVTVPKGYMTNGSNVPRIFWSIIPPFKPIYSPAYLVHDYLCDLEQYEKADQYFKELLYNTENSFTTFSMWAGVRIYHKIRYGK